LAQHPLLDRVLGLGSGGSAYEAGRSEHVAGEAVW